MILSRFKPELGDIISKNFEEFTQIQKQAMPGILNGRNTPVLERDQKLL